MKKFKGFLIALAILLFAVPAFAVFNEKDLAHTLSVLRFELHQQNEKMENFRSMLLLMNERQHDEMINMVKKCNELSLILYSQNTDFTFDMTYALKEVTDKYEDYSSRRMPFDELVQNLNIEIDRYERLIEALRRLPPALEEMDEVPDSLLNKELDIEIGAIHDHLNGFQHDGHHHETFILDEQSCINRDSCIFYAKNLLSVYVEARDQIVNDNEYYNEMNDRLNDSYQYAQERYRQIQKKIFIKGQDKYFNVLKRFRMYALMAFSDAKQKYGKAVNYDDGCAIERTSVIEAVAEAVGLGHDSDDTCHVEEHAHEDHEFVSPTDHTDDLESFLAAEHHDNAEMEEHDHDHEHEHMDGEEHEHHHHHENQSEWRGPVVSAFIFIVLLLIIVATLASTLITLLLNKKVKRFRTPEFKMQFPCIMLLAGMVVFAITIMIADSFIKQNFIVMASTLLLVFAWLVSAILVSILIRVPANLSTKTMMTYIPMMIMGLVVITFRIIFIPNRLVNLIFPPMLLGFAIWQFFICHKGKDMTQKIDRIYGYISLLVMAVTTIISWYGYVLLSVQVFIWWLFQLAAISTITAVYELLNKYEYTVIKKRLVEYRKNHIIIDEKANGAFVEVTWFFDLVEEALVPVVTILTIPFCIWLAADVFDLTELCKDILMKPFFDIKDADGNAILHLSLYKLLISAELFFIFRYVAYIVKALYRHIRYEHLLKKRDNNHIHTNEINLTLANNLVSIIVWGIYIITLIVIFKIPMGAISIVAAGLATGIGLALKDVLNNFIYGIQLMSGRLRVGDYIDCDGIRGKVESISYQSTEIHTLDGSIMAITNTALFNKNFKNLTKNNFYELVKIPVGVHYGANVAEVRDLLLEALKELQKKDKYGRNIVDPVRGVTIAFNDFGDSSVDLVVKQFVIVDQEPAYIAAAKEIIYNTLNANNIEIPFPQRDVYIRQVPDSTEK